MRKILLSVIATAALAAAGAAQAGPGNPLKGFNTGGGGGVIASTELAEATDGVLVATQAIREGGRTVGPGVATPPGKIQEDDSEKEYVAGSAVAAPAAYEVADASAPPAAQLP